MPDHRGEARGAALRMDKSSDAAAPLLLMLHGPRLFGGLVPRSSGVWWPSVVRGFSGMVVVAW
ncbi:MAG: hypothetical protein VYC44_06515 [Chloroflexota bacterium]|nr:hypothetical protein [Chloroflexota bacterium]